MESISLLPPPPTYCSHSSVKVDICIITSDKICTLKLWGWDAVSVHLACMFRRHAYRAFNAAYIQIVKWHFFCVQAPTEWTFLVCSAVLTAFKFYCQKEGEGINLKTWDPLTSTWARSVTLTTKLAEILETWKGILQQGQWCFYLAVGKDAREHN